MNGHETEIKNNKEMIPLEQYLAQFAAADPLEMSQRSGADYDPESRSFHLFFFSRPCSITWPDFGVSCDDGAEVYCPLVSANQAKIFVLRYLLGGVRAPASGRFMTYREVPWGEVYYRQFNGRCQKRLEFGWGTSKKKLEEFECLCRKMNFRRIDGADAAFEFEILPGFYTRFLIWLGDDEFPPSSQILFSDNFAAAFHAEDLVAACEIATGALKACLK